MTDHSTMSPRFDTRPLPASIADAATMIRQGQLTAESLTRSVLARVRALNETVGSLISRADDDALAAARRADEELARGQDRGPLHGIPIGIKDIIAVEGMTTTAQSPTLDPGFHDGRDATVVARLREAGAVFVGKTTTMEYAIGMPEPDHDFPLPRNPWDLERWAGGSSSGSASGVAAGFFLGALGTDTGGSVRLPSAWCGITGLKPTNQSIPLDGIIPLGFTHDIVGPMARTARDCRDMFDVMARGSRPIDSGSEQRASLRVGVPYTVLDEVGCDHEVAERFAEALDVLRDLGHVVVPVEVRHVPEVRIANDVSMAVESWLYHQVNLRERWEEYGWQTRTAIVRGALTSAGEYLHAQRVRRVAADELDVVLDDVDLIAAPTHPYPPPRMFDLQLIGGLLEVNLTSFWNSCGYPALSVPMGRDASGLPAGLHLGGRPHSEAMLLALGEHFQEATQHHLVTPDLEVAHV